VNNEPSELVQVGPEDFLIGIVLGILEQYYGDDYCCCVDFTSAAGHEAALQVFTWLDEEHAELDLRFFIKLDPWHGGVSSTWEQAILEKSGLLLRQRDWHTYQIDLPKHAVEHWVERFVAGPWSLWQEASRRYLAAFDQAVKDNVAERYRFRAPPVH
jgi:hypothetical protein